jgi:hypothetical protein
LIQKQVVNKNRVMEHGDQTLSLSDLLFNYSTVVTQRKWELVPNAVAAKRILQASFLLEGNPGNCFIREEARKRSIVGPDILVLLKSLKTFGECESLATTLLKMRNVVSIFLRFFLIFSWRTMASFVSLLSELVDTLREYGAQLETHSKELDLLLEDLIVVFQIILGECQIQISMPVAIKASPVSCLALPRGHWLLLGIVDGKQGSRA